jgi:hypothetical protein
VWAGDVGRPVGIAQAKCDGAWHTIADGPPIDLDDWHDAAGGGGVEHLVGIVEIVGRQPLLARGQPRLGRQLEDCLPRDPFQETLGRRVEPAIARDEDIRASPFGHVAVEIEHDRVVGASVERVEARQVAMQPVEGLDLGVDALDGDVTDGADAHSQPTRRHSGGDDLEIRHGVDDDRRFPLADRRILPHAAGGDDLDVGVLQPAAAHRLHDQAAERLARERDGDPRGVQRAVEARDVGLELEDAAAPRREHVEDVDPQPEPGVHQRQGGPVGGNELAIEIGQAWIGRHTDSLAKCAAIVSPYRHA